MTTKTFFQFLEDAPTNATGDSAVAPKERPLFNKPGDRRSRYHNDSMFMLANGKWFGRNKKKTIIDEVDPEEDEEE